MEFSDPTLCKEAIKAVLGSIVPDLGGYYIDLPVGTTLTRNLSENLLKEKVVLTPACSPLYLQDLIRLGPSGLIAGLRSLQQLEQAATAIATKGAFYFGPNLSTSPLSRSEARLLQAYVSLSLEGGCPNAKSLARRLGISHKTVANQLLAIREKLGARTQLQLLRAYFFWPNC